MTSQMTSQMTKLDIQISKNETLSKEYEFSYSLLLFFLKSHFWLTDKRLIINAPNVFVFIPTGNDTATYPLRQLTAVKTKTEFKFASLAAGIFFLVLGLSTLRYGIGLLFLVLGLGGIVGSFRNLIWVVSSGGTGTGYSYLPWQAADAKKMVNHLNMLLADL